MSNVTAIPTSSVFIGIIDPLFGNIAEQHHRLELSNLLLDYYVLPMAGEYNGDIALMSNLTSAMESVLSVEQRAFAAEKMGSGNIPRSKELLIAYQLFCSAVLVTASEFVTQQFSGGKHHLANWAYTALARFRAAGSYIGAGAHNPNLDIGAWMINSFQQHLSLTMQQQNLARGVSAYGQPGAGFMSPHQPMSYTQQGYHSQATYKPVDKELLRSQASTLIGGVNAHGEEVWDHRTEAGGLGEIPGANAYNGDLRLLRDSVARYVREGTYAECPVGNFSVHPNLRVHVNGSGVELFYIPNPDAHTNMRYYDQVRLVGLGSGLGYPEQMFEAVTMLIESYDRLVTAGTTCTEVDGELRGVPNDQEWNLTLAYVRLTASEQFPGTTLHAHGIKTIVTQVKGDEPSVKVYLTNV